MKQYIVPIIVACVAIIALSCRTAQKPPEEVAPIEPIQPMDSGQAQVPEEEIQPQIEEPIQPEEPPKMEITLSEKYLVEGKNPGGRIYNGTLDVLKRGDSYDLTMKMKTRTITGTATLDGNKLTIFWGKNRRFEYEVKEDGKITSIWEKGEELFTPINK